MRVNLWTGREAAALQAALRETNEGFAERLGVAVRTVAVWNAKPDVKPRAEMQQLLDRVLETAHPIAVERFRDQLEPAVNAVAAPQALRAAIAVVVKDHDQVLLVCRRVEDASPLRWQFPAGIVKPGGSPDRTAERETLAETGVSCAAVKELGSRLHPVTRVLCDYLLCEYLAGEPSNLDQVENMDVTWVALDRLDKFIPDSAIYPPVLAALKGSAA